MLKVLKINKNAVIPTRGTVGSAGLDLSACISSDIVIKPNETILIPTGLSMSLDSHEFVGLIYARSGLSVKHSIALANSVGVIDSDYRGEVKVPLRNYSNIDFTIKNGDRIAQLVVTPICYCDAIEVDSLDSSDRGENGFGSTGK